MFCEPWCVLNSASVIKTRPRLRSNDAARRHYHSNTKLHIVNYADIQHFYNQAEIAP